MACRCFVWLGALPPVLNSCVPRPQRVCENPALWTMGARSRLHGKRVLKSGAPFPCACSDHCCSVESRVKLTGALLNSSAGPSTVVSYFPPAEGPGARLA